MSDEDERYLRRLGARVREQRKFLKLSQADVAERANVGSTTVRLVEQGAVATTVTILSRVAGALQMYPSDLLELVEADLYEPARGRDA